MSGLVWDFQSSARISRAVRKVEQTGQSQFDDLAFMPRLAGSLDWVKTPSSLPGGYDGTDPLDGVKVVRLPDGTIHEHPQAVFILDPNGTPLEADKIYPAQFAGTYDDGSTIQGLYLVQAGGSGTGSGVTVGWYNGGTVTGTTTQILVNGSTMTIGGRPWGNDAANAFGYFGPSGFNMGSAPAGQARWVVLLRDLISGTNNYSIVPFVLPVELKLTTYLFFNPSVLVCRAINSGGAFSFVAHDWAKLIPPSAAGYVFRGNIISYPVLISGFSPYAWNLISVDLANPVSAGSGVSLSGAAFPSGMGGAFPGPKTTNLNGVE